MLKYKYINRNNNMKKISKQFRDELRNKSTESERKFKKILNRLGIDFQFQKVVNIYKGREIEKFYIVDFYLPLFNCVIEIDGGYHDQYSQRIEDRIREFNIKDTLKCFFIRIKNDRVNTPNVRKIFKKNNIC